jgi:hypothetical protein
LELQIQQYAEIVEEQQQQQQQQEEEEEEEYLLSEFGKFDLAMLRSTFERLPNHINVVGSCGMTVLGVVAP